MSNFFDQFDAAPSSNNYFDQFDAPAKPQGQWGPVSEAANAVLMGAGPTLTGAGAYLRGDDYGAAKQAAQQAQAAYEVQNPKMATGASVVGGAVPAIAMTAMGIPPVFAGGIQGAGPGTFAGDPGQAILGALTGAGGTAAFQGLGRALTGIGRATGLVAPAAPTAPAQAALRDVGGGQFNTMRDSGATFPAAAVQGQAAGGAADLARGGYTPGPFGTAPKANGLVGALSDLAPTPRADPMRAMTGVTPAPPAPVGITELDALRKAAGNIRGPGVDPSDQAGASIIGHRILDLYETNPAIAELSANARGNTAAAFRSEDLQNALTNADNRASSTGSGMNVGNSVRGRVATLIDPNHPERAAAFGPELPALQKIVDGGAGQNIARMFGNVLGGGAGLGGATVGIAGAHALGPVGAAIPFVGTGLKAVDNMMARRALMAADEATRMRSPLGQQAQAAFVPPSGIPSQIGRALAPSIGAAISNPGMGALFGN